MLSTKLKSLICDISRDNLPEGDKELLAMLRKLQDVEINKYVSRNSPFSGVGKTLFTMKPNLPAETKELMAEYLCKLKKYLQQPQGSPFVYFPIKSFKNNQSGNAAITGC